MGPNCKQCSRNQGTSCSKQANLWTFCACGCGGTFQKFTKYNAATPKLFAHDTKCKYRCRRKQADYGEVLPSMWRECCVCGEWVPIFSFDTQRMRRDRITCSRDVSNCSVLANHVKREKTWKEKPGPKSRKIGRWDGGDDGLRHTYCRQEAGQCANYEKCLGEDGTFETGMELYGKTKGSCYQEPKPVVYGYQAIDYRNPMRL